ncbi:LacI family DNA-binding transcriptional regulator [Microbacterium indicum]|uniref:LacI family DNA-binding transcriptional regulator n=1 Tax=Microbacterium indicum TaxID=358100 RepID=UPI00041D987F|nr:LacI family DNA-binding transcriptional regulator [Microbacterium indicum]
MAAPRVTAAQVAKEARVSQATVSYVLNDKPHGRIPEETRRRVLDAARKLNYTPSAAARALRLGRSNLVLIVLPDWPLGYAMSGFIDRLTDHLEQVDLQPVIRRLKPGMPVGDLWQAIMPAAVLLLDDVGRGERASMRAAGVFVAHGVLWDEDHDDDPVLARGSLVGALQVEHLVATGHRRVGYLAPRAAHDQLFSRLRIEGAEAACLDLGIDRPQVRSADLTPEAIRQALDGWWAEEPDRRVTAVCAYSDDYAFALLAAMRDAGLRAPDDLAVIGADDVPLALFADPPLTTIDHEQEVVVAHLARVIGAGIRGEEAPEAPPMHPSVVIRRSA